MRLIDADVLLQDIRENMPNYEVKEDFLLFVHAQPTAYDVEKVVEELADNSRFIYDINEHNIKCISCVIGQKTAIDIVKAGGINE